jgi:hypothetical protein
VQIMLAHVAVSGQTKGDKRRAWTAAANNGRVASKLKHQLLCFLWSITPIGYARHARASIPAAVCSHVGDAAPRADGERCTSAAVPWSFGLDSNVLAAANAYATHPPASYLLKGGGSSQGLLDCSQSSAMKRN